MTGLRGTNGASWPWWASRGGVAIGAIGAMDADAFAAPLRSALR
jgi:hypothetical protein